MSNVIPVVFCHEGNQEYLNTAIEQAKRHNDIVVLLGDSENARSDVRYSSWEHWKSPEFQRVYKHMSTNHEEFELRCFQRWFAIERWAREHNVEGIFYSDSDVMLYCNITEWAESVDKPDVSFQVPQHQPGYRWSASAHVSLWTLEALREFCEFVSSEYCYVTLSATGGRLTNKWQWHQETDTAGGVCDMTLLFLWWQETLEPDGWGFVNNATVIDGATFDHNINVAENYGQYDYLMQGDHKLVETGTHDGPHLLLELGPQLIKANALHFQGQAKAWMKEYQR